MEPLKYKDIWKLGCDTIPGCIEILLNAVVKVALPVAAIMIIWSGFLFLTALGSEEKIKKARSTLTWTLIGLAIVVGAWTLAIASKNFFFRP